MTPILALILTFAAPQEGTVRGMVRVQGTLEPIAGATVRIPDLGRMALTDARGYFVFADVPAGQWRVVASALGYREHEVTVALEQTTNLEQRESSLRPTLQYRCTYTHRCHTLLLDSNSTQYGRIALFVK